MDDILPNLILFNGKFFTQDPNNPVASAVAIKDGRFLCVGDNVEIQSLSKSKTKNIDLDGHRVLPGITDAHFHYVYWALGRYQLPLEDTLSFSDLLARLNQRMQETKPGEWIIASGWNETHWVDPHLPTRAKLDPVTPENPVILWRYDGHLAVANSLALEQSGVDATTPDPPGGIIDRDESGQPTGVLRELATYLVDDIIPPYTENEIMSAMREGFTDLHRLGLTGIHDMGSPEASSVFRFWMQLWETGDLGLRAWVSIPVEQLDEAIAMGLRTGFGDTHLRVGHVKAFADGSQGARTAWMLEPYEDGGSGLSMIPPKEITEIVRRANDAGLSMAIHAIGDRANREILNVFEKISHDVDLFAPNRIEHVQNIRPSDVTRLAQLGISASVQPVHVVDDRIVIEQSVGKRGRFTYAFQDMLNAGATLAFGSDCPVSRPNPFLGIHAAVTRQQPDGTPEGGWYPAQRLSLEDAVWGFTFGPALASGREAELGSIAPGKLADLVVLDRDIFNIDPMEIASIKPILTIFHGQEVYRA